jgi:hypothetical protein
VKAFITLVPTRRNDGSEVPRGEQDAILQALRERFGGLTIEGIVEGHWIDPADGRLYVDQSLKIVVAFEAERLTEARQAVRDIGKQLGQIAMYFEVRDGIEFLTTND